MDTLSYRTQSVNKESAAKKWVVVDAEGQTLGRLASRVAYVLRGKHRATFTPHADTGDNVIIINAEKVAVSGNKTDAKEYIRYTGYPGGQRKTSFETMLNDKPARVLEKAVKGMLPKNKLGRALYRNLFVYEGAEHKHDAQQPVALDLNSINK